MDNNNHNHGNSNGFLLGVIVGVLITLLFTTKRGRVIFKEILEKGIQKFSNLEELMQDASLFDDDEDFEEDDTDYIPAQPIVTAPPVEKKPEKKIVEEKPEPKQEKEIPAPKPVVQEVSPEPETPVHGEKEEKKSPTPAVEQKVEQETVVQEETPHKAKATKRWFRGLRRRS